MSEDEVFWYPDVNVVRAELDEGVASIDLGSDEDGKPTIKVAKSLSKPAVDELVRQARERHKRPRWRSVPAAIAAFVHHTRQAGDHTTLATSGVLLGGVMLAVVVTGSAPLQQQAGGPPITAPRSQPDVDVDPLGRVPLQPLSMQPAQVPATARGRSGGTGQARTPGSSTADLASAGVPVAGSHPLKPTRTMVAASVRSALPTVIPVPQHPVRCVVQFMIRHGTPAEVRRCI